MPRQVLNSPSPYRVDEDIYQYEEEGACNKVYPDRRQIFIYDDITAKLALDISEVSGYLKTSTSPLEIKINSSGGSLYATLAIVGELMNIPTQVVVDITGVALSGAAMVALAGDFIRISKFGIIMLHYPNWGAERQPLYSHKTDVKQMELLCDRFFKEILANTKLSFDEFKKLGFKNDLYLTPKQALKYGIVHEVY